MTEEPMLTLRLSSSDHFQCSLCDEEKFEGKFAVSASMYDLLASFEDHVKTWHTDKNFSQAAMRIVKEATKD
jgi:hypothetical protein